MGSNLNRPCVNKILTWFVEWLVSGMSLSFRSSLVYSWKRKTLARWVTPCIYDLSRIKLFIDQFKHWATLIKHTIKLDYFECQCNGEPVLSMTLSFERSFFWFALSSSRSMKHHGSFGHELLIPNTFFPFETAGRYSSGTQRCSIYNAVAVHGKRHRA